MAVKKCSYCGELYDFDNGHDYDKCVQECERRYDISHKFWVEANWALTKAKEVQKQDWWRARVNAIK